MSAGFGEMRVSSRHGGKWHSDRLEGSLAIAGKNCFHLRDFLCLRFDNLSA